mmetsp:Transcript_13714/g.42454  ORF Transcript_13714/g.42454 Transcript_13714/m.42454 type:complete len:206 (+) Transcript_13714:137-754(+)
MGSHDEFSQPNPRRSALRAPHGRVRCLLQGVNILIHGRHCHQVLFLELVVLGASAHSPHQLTTYVACDLRQWRLCNGSRLLLCRLLQGKLASLQPLLVLLHLVVRDDLASLAEHDSTNWPRQCHQPAPEANLCAAQLQDVCRKYGHEDGDEHADLCHEDCLLHLFVPKHAPPDRLVEGTGTIRANVLGENQGDEGHGPRIHEAVL